MSFATQKHTSEKKTIQIYNHLQHIYLKGFSCLYTLLLLLSLKSESRRSSRSNARAIGNVVVDVSSITATRIVDAPASIVDDNVGALDALDGQYILAKAATTPGKGATVAPG
jgi:hypothetical protein